MTASCSPQLEIISWQPETEGEKPGAPIIVLVHGACHTAAHWQCMQPLLANAGYTSLAVNLRGHGHSEGKERLLQASLQDYVDDIRGIIRDQLQERSYVLIGHSLGGYIAQLVCQQEQQYAPVGVVLLNTVTPKLSGRVGRSPAFLLRGLFSFRQTLMALRQGDMNLLHPTPQRVREAFFSSQASDEMVQFCYMHLQSEPFAPTQQVKRFPSPETGAPRLQAPLLIIGSEKDRVVPPELLRATAAAYGTTPIIFPKMGHNLMLDAGYEQVIAAIIEWMEHHPEMLDSLNKE